MFNFHTIIFSGETLAALQETSDLFGCPPTCEKALHDAQIFSYPLNSCEGVLAKNVRQPATVLMGVYPYELPPKEFAIYLKMRDNGVNFPQSPAFAPEGNLGQNACIFLETGDGISPAVMEYIQYFFEDSGCPLVFVPVLGKNETLPEALRTLPPGGVLEDLSLLVQYNFICATTDPMLFEGARNLQEAAIQAAVKCGRFGVITAVACEGIRGVYRQFSAADICGFDRAVSHALQGFINEYVIAQAALPFKDADPCIALLSPYISPNILDTGEKGAVVQISQVINDYANVEVEGFFVPQTAGHELEIACATDLLHFEMRPVVETVADKFIPRFAFSCRATLENGETQLTFTQGHSPVYDIAMAADCTRNYFLSVNSNQLDIKRFAARPYYKISCIIPAFNAGEYIGEAVQSVLDQDLDFFPNTQIILVNDGSTDATHDICTDLAQKYPYNIVYVRQSHEGVSAARNTGLRHAMGNFITFLDADDTLDTNLLQLGTKTLEEKKHANTDFVAFPIKMFGADNAPAPDLDFRFARNATIDLGKSPQKSQFSACGVIIRAAAIHGLQFDENLFFSEDVDFMCRALAAKQQYFACKDAFYNYRIAPSKYAGNTGQYGGAALFAGGLATFFANEGYGPMPPYAQYAILYDIVRAMGSGAPHSPADSAGDISQSITQMAKALAYVNDDFILNVRNLSPVQQEYLLYLKRSGGNDHARIENGAFYAGNHHVSDLGHPVKDVSIDYVREVGDYLQINGAFYLLAYGGIALVAQYGGKTYTASLFPDERQTVSVFGQTVGSARAFSVYIPLSAVQHDKEITLELKHEADYFPVTLHFPSKFLFVGKKVTVSARGSHLLTSLPGQSNLPALLAGAISDKGVMHEYMSMHSFLSKSRIWLFVDPSHGLSKSATAHLYDYCAAKQDGIDKYFAAHPDTVVDGDGVIAYGSKTFELLVMFAEKIVVSDLDLLLRLKNAFTPATFVFAPSAILTKDRRLQELTGIPLAMVALSSPAEKDVLPKGQVEALGMVVGSPVYQNLTDSGQRRILFMPAYRNHLYLGPNKLNPRFAASQYATCIGDLLLNERFLDTADALGICVDFAPHEKTYLQLSDFEMDESITVIPPAFPRVGLCQNAAMLITDTLPAYEFAYLGKPVVYFQFDSDGSVPKDGGVFGECVDNFDELIALLVEYMENDFALKPEYAAQNEAFFACKDKNSCRRIYAQMTANDGGLV